MHPFEKILKDNMKHVRRKCRINSFRYRIDYDDLLGDSLEKLWRYKDRFRYEDGDKGFCNWVGFVVHSVCVDTYRRNKKHFGNIDIENAIKIGMNQSSYEDAQLAERSWQVLQRYHKRYHHLIGMLNDGYGYQEIADVLDMNINTVKGAIYRMHHTMIEERKKLQEV